MGPGICSGEFRADGLAPRDTGTRAVCMEMQAQCRFKDDFTGSRYRYRHKGKSCREKRSKVNFKANFRQDVSQFSSSE